MIINFFLENFRMFYQRNVFSMEKGKKREQNEKIIKVNANQEYALLPTKVIYGVNASGKSSLITALYFLSILIKKGTLEADELVNLPIYHFIHDTTKFFEPLKLGIAFIADEARIDYEVDMQNYEVDDTVDSKIVYERLAINNVEVFKRVNNKVKFNSAGYHKIRKYWFNIDATDLNNLERIYSEQINDTVVFTNWFSINGELVSLIKKWWDKVRIITDLDSIRYNLPSLKTESWNKKLNYINHIIINLVKEADFGPQKIEFKYNSQDEVDNNNQIANLYSQYIVDNEDAEYRRSVQVPSEITESVGTLKLIKFIAPFVDTIIDGGVIVVDELDASLHPEVVAAIVKTFADPEVNTKGAQLLFTTHDPVYLNHNLFRRDEIVFVEKNYDTLESTISTLDDFDIRGDERYLKNYLEGKYINFVNIDFSHIIKEYQKEIKHEKD